jgi:hypothetical protein
MPVKGAGSRATIARASFAATRGLSWGTCLVLAPSARPHRLWRAECPLSWVHPLSVPNRTSPQTMSFSRMVDKEPTLLGYMRSCGHKRHRMNILHKNRYHRLNKEHNDYTVHYPPQIPRHSTRSEGGRTGCPPDQAQHPGRTSLLWNPKKGINNGLTLEPCQASDTTFQAHLKFNCFL